MWLQKFIENTAVDVMSYQVDVRDIGKAHVLAAEVGPHAILPSAVLQTNSCAATHVA